MEYRTSLEEIEYSLLVEVAPPPTMMTEYLFAFAFIVFFDKTLSCIKLYHYIILKKSQAQKGKKSYKSKFFAYIFDIWQKEIPVVEIIFSTFWQ
jgi:hypothetical protein